MRDVDLHVGQDMPELKPVETGPLPPQPTEVASPVEEAGTIRHETGAGSPRPSVVGGCHDEVGNNAGQENGIPIASVDTCWDNLTPKYTSTIFSYWAGLLGLPYNNNYD